jgi:isopropylmalate/homocitrate/citramalate synthase
MSKESDFFLYPNNRYNGNFTPEYLIFNSNLQEFTQKISYICSLETAGKLTPEESYQQIKRLWKELKRSKKQLGIGAEMPPNDSEESED